ncbi:MAG: esterase-like activity of phytase family protein [Novosphingobium sp.]
MRRIALVLFCAVLLALSWGRSPVPPSDNDGHVSFARLSIAGLPPPGAGMKLLDAWQLRSAGDAFGGYSTLVALDGGAHFLSASDRGRELRFRDPSLGDPQARMGYFVARGGADKLDVDVEGLTRDPASGTIWASYEQTNRIVRIGPDAGALQAIAPPAMRHWPSNSGPEAILHLADGRFLVLEEAQGEWWSRRPGAGLLFPGDPVEGSRPERFRFAAPEGFSPTDIAQLPDGRVLILLRKVVFPIPPRFAGALLLADPAEIRPGRVWTGKIVARFAPPLPVDNYEGLEIVPDEAGAVIVWIISDDNTAVTQRTLLLKLRWTPPLRDAEDAKRARGDAARPRS